VQGRHKFLLLEKASNVRIGPAEGVLKAFLCAQLCGGTEEHMAAKSVVFNMVRMSLRHEDEEPYVHRRVRRLQRFEHELRATIRRDMITYVVFFLTTV
jgi:hypothetical protein